MRPLTWVRAWSGAALVFALGGAVLTWGALPYLPGQLDEAYIVFAYAHRLVEYGEVAWNTGARVEGYSSALHLFLLAMAAADGVDLAVASRLLSFVCSLGVLGLLLQRRFGPGRAALVLLVAAWQPFQHWSVAGLETALATLIAVAAWPLVLGTRTQWAAGTGLCVLLSLARPEGLAWLGLALLRRLKLGRTVGEPEAEVVAAVGTFAAYHAFRVQYFGHVLPTPFPVKIELLEWTAGLSQMGREGLSAAGLLVLVVSLRQRVDRWVWLPLLVQAAWLVRAGGDALGHGRFIVPGLLATVAAAMAHAAPRPAHRALWVAVPVLGLFGFGWEPARDKGEQAGLRNRWYLEHPIAAVTHLSRTPMLEDVSFLVERVPENAGAYISDVGLPGNLSDIRIWDGVGLTEDDLWCSRRTTEGREDLVDLMVEQRFPELTPARADNPLLVWRCRAGGEPAPALVTERWRHLADRFPSQKWIRWYLARSLLVSDHVEAALAEAAKGPRDSGEGAGWVAWGERPTDAYQEARGWGLVGNGRIRSLPLPATFWQGYALAVDVDDPGVEGALVRVGWEGGCGPAQERRVMARTTLALPPCDTDGPRRLAFEFLNDAFYPGFDRNVYVSLAPKQ